MKITRKQIKDFISLVMGFLMAIILFDLFWNSWSMEGVDWSKAIGNLIFFFIVAIPSYKYLKTKYKEVHLPVEYEDRVQRELIKIGAEFLKKNGNRKTYKIPGDLWFYEIIKVTKTSQHIHLKVPQEYVDYFESPPSSSRL